MSQHQAPSCELGPWAPGLSLRLFCASASKTRPAALGKPKGSEGTRIYVLGISKRLLVRNEMETLYVR